MRDLHEPRICVCSAEVAFAAGKSAGCYRRYSEFARKFWSSSNGMEVWIVACLVGLCVADGVVCLVTKASGSGQEDPGCTFRDLPGRQTPLNPWTTERLSHPETEST